ncbi:TlpA family protein disulfide reductase [Algoriphagus taiwanensis]|uniref:TlpA family protein disulfide reductase n=1 Tax=Algoriphagus taiwanensis TaxID=1445656 RepID=UPI0030C69FAA
MIKFKLDFTDEELRSALNLIPSDSWYHGEIGTYLTLNESTRAKIGEPAPDFSLESKSGEMFQLSEQKGKYTLLEFSYTGCPYCFLAIPELRKFHDEMGDQIQVVSLWKDQTKKIWLESQSDHKSQITWTNVWDPNGLSSSLFDIKIWPSYVLIDPEGKVKSIWSGYKKGSSLSKKIQREISL